jgi:hypothetical protein
LRLETLDCRACGAGTSIGLEEQPKTLLYPAIGIEDYLIGCVVDQTHGERHAQLASACLVENPALQPRPKHMQFRLAHRAFESQQQAVIEVAGIINAIFIEDERIAEGANLEQPMPIGRVARKPRDLQPQNNTGFAQAHLRHQPLKSLPVGGGSPGLAQIGIDHDDALDRPAKRHGLAPQRVLALRALRVLKDLP